MTKCVILRKVLPHIDFDFGNMSHKSWASVYCCVVSPLFLTTVHKCLEMEETSCWTSGRGCSLFSSFIDAPVGERSGQPCLVIDAVCSLTLSWWNMQKTEKDNIWMGCAFQDWCCLSLAIFWWLHWARQHAMSQKLVSWKLQCTLYSNDSHQISVQ